jgi:hypothetical protein
VADEILDRADVMDQFPGPAVARPAVRQGRYASTPAEASVARSARSAAVASAVSGSCASAAGMSSTIVLYSRPKYSEATVKGSIASTHCFINILAYSSMRYAGLYGAASLPYLVTTLPKTITDSRHRSQHNPLLYPPLPLLSLPKRGAFSKVSCMEKHWLLPRMTASLYLGHVHCLLPT